MTPKRVVLTAVVLSLLLPAICFAQVTAADYERAAKLRDRFQGLAVNIPEAANAIDNTHRFWYRKGVKGGNEFVLVDADAVTKKPAFDHERLAVSLSTAAKEKYTAVTLPFTTFQYADNAAAITFTAAGSNWKCDLTDYACRKTANGGAGQGQRGAPPAPPAADINDESPSEFANDVEDGMTYVSPQQGQRGGGGPAGGPQAQNNPKVSPDDKLEALILNFNVFLRPKGKTQPADAWPLSFDGSEGNYYTLRFNRVVAGFEPSRSLSCSARLST